MKILAFVLIPCFTLAQNNQEEPISKRDEGVTAPKALFSPHPTLTREAWQKGVTGRVSLKLEVLPDGTPHNITVVSGLDPGLDQTAVDAVEHWRFQPATKNGVPIPVQINVIVGFLGPTSASPKPGVYRGLGCADKIDGRDLATLLKKASKGDPKAQITMGCAYEYGLAELPPDRAEAIVWYRKAAEAGLVPAQYFLGEAYLLGFDYVPAYTWLKIAESGGYKDNKQYLPILAKLLSTDQLREADAQVSEWKRLHGLK